MKRPGSHFASTERMAEGSRLSKWFSVWINRGMLFLAAVLLIILSAISLYVAQIQTRINETNAIHDARVLSDAVAAFRSLYTSEVVQRLSQSGVRITHDYDRYDNAIPLPATLSMMLGARVGEAGTGVQTRLYSPYPFPWRRETGGLRDEFATQAWASLNAEPDQPYYRFEQIEGRKLLRYAVADKMRQACVGCHNAHDDTPKNDWKVGEVRGVLEVRYPMESVILDSEQGMKELTVVMLGIGVLALFALTYSFGRVRQTTEATRKINEELAYSNAMLEEKQTQLVQRQKMLFETKQELERYNQKLISYNKELDASRIATLNLLHDVDMSRTAAETANQAKSAFLATMSHELRTPLNAITGFSEMMIGEFFGALGSPKYKEYANDIRTSSGYLLNLINDILDLSAIEAGKLSLTKESLDVDDVIKSCSPTISTAAEYKGIKYLVEVPENLRPLHADRRALKQVLLNILSNAVKFTPTGGQITFKVTVANNHHIFEVSDTGEGVSGDKLASLADPFFRAESDPYKAQEGSGLGLSIVKSLVDLHNGNLEIKSEPAEGMTVTIMLPSDEPD